MAAITGEASSEELAAEFIGAQQMQELETAASQAPELRLPPITEQLLLDFYLSFRFSQASEEVQTNLFRALIKEYRRAGAEPTEEDLELVKTRLSSLKPPNQHTRIVSSRLGEFGKMWGKLEETFSDTSGSELGRGELLELGQGMAERDIIYQAKSRPNREIGSDLHESFFRTYVLEGASTQSPTYDSVMRQIRLACAGVRGPEAEKFVELEAVWEHVHRGRKFYPDFEAEAA